jgi:hypothetical protein
MGISPFNPDIRRAVEKGLIPAAVVKEVAAPLQKPKRKRRLVALDQSAGWSITLTPACRVVTEANTHEFWTERKRRFDVQKAAILDAYRRSPLTLIRGSAFDQFLPLIVTLTHVGPRMDDDNLRGAFKGIRDAIAWLMAMDDGDERVKWQYEQRTGKPGVQIRFEKSA